MLETASILTIPLLTVHVVVVVRLTLARAGSNDNPCGGLIYAAVHFTTQHTTV
jgi:hypothetical protein